MKKFQTDNPNSAPEQMTVERSNTLASNTALVPKTRRVEAPLVSKVGMNLEYCELCEEKLSPNPNTAFKHYSSRGHLKVNSFLSDLSKGWIFMWICSLDHSWNCF